MPSQATADNAPQPDDESAATPDQNRAIRVSADDIRPSAVTTATPPVEIPTQMMSRADLDELRGAIKRLETPGLAVRLSQLIGMPVEMLLKALPDSATRIISMASESAMRRCLLVALTTMRDGHAPPSDRFHKVVAATSGLIGGAAGLPGMLIELPFTTSLMFRSIADIARSEGEDLRSPATVASCLEVFALSGPGKADDGAESAYFATRLALSKSVMDLSSAFAEGALKAEAPALLRFLAKLTARFGIVVSEKAAAQAAPLIGSVGGAVVNTLFMDHFQNMARGHFTVRRLERKYDRELVQKTYMALLHRQPIDAATITPTGSLVAAHAVVDP